MIEWGPGSPRPDYFMLYRYGDIDEYLGTYLTLRAAITEVVRLGGRPLACEMALPPALPNRSPAVRVTPEDRA
jgi:hypothetical protein